MPGGPKVYVKIILKKLNLTNSIAFFVEKTNKNVTYIPDYNKLYIGDLNEQIYVSRFFKENQNRRVEE